MMKDFTPINLKYPRFLAAACPNEQIVQGMLAQLWWLRSSQHKYESLQKEIATAQNDPRGIRHAIGVE